MTGGSIVPVDGCVVVPRPDRGLLRLAGEDRVRFLNGQTTCDIATLGVGESVYGFFVGLKGRVESDVVVLAGDDALWLDLPVDQVTPIAERLRKYAILDRVEIEPVEWVALGLVGSGIDDVLAAVDLEDGLRKDSLRKDSLRMDLAPLAGLDGPLPSMRVWLERASLERASVEQASLEQASLERFVAAGAVPLDPEAWDVVRVEAGRPRVGVDVGSAHFPQEVVADPATLEAAISYTKGCYLGQEVVARIHYRGGVQRRLAGVRIESSDALETAVPESETDAPEPLWGPKLVGATLRVDGRSVGQLGTVVRSPRLGPIGLAVVHQRAEDGAEVEIVVEDAERPLTGRVVGLPFVRSD